MTKPLISFIVLLLCPAVLTSQAVIGVWQGALRDGSPPARVIIRIAASKNGHLSGSLSSIEGGDGFDRSYSADSTSLRGDRLTVTWTDVHVKYVGTLSSPGKAIHGTWTEESTSQPLDLTRANEQGQWHDESRHSRRLVTVEKNVQLEVVDWGGNGRPIVLLAGNGNTAHVFDQFAPKLTNAYHVYGITRRGFGRSSTPVGGYLSDSLANDVLAVIDSLGIDRPVLIGHSLAGQELSSIGSRHPDRVAGLVYLEAGYQYAFYDSAQGGNTGLLSIRDTQRKLGRLVDPGITMTVKERGAVIAELLQTSIPLMERDLRLWQLQLAARPNQSATGTVEANPVARAIALGHQKYLAVNAPVLAIFACPREVPTDMAGNSVSRARWDSLNVANVGPQIRAFERGIPSARVINIPHANHYVFRSNEGEVLQAIRAFLDMMPTS